MHASETAKKVAQHLLDIQALRINTDNPFKWSSGWNSPIYCDNRISLSYPEIRTYIKHELAALVKREFASAGCIAGVATAGIAQGALVADTLGLPFIYVRPEPKKHGMGNQIEGRLPGGANVVLIEDLISTGGSSLKAVQALRDAGANVTGLAAIFSYGFTVATENFENAQVPFHTLSNYNELLQVGLQNGLFKEELLPLLEQWRSAPSTWPNLADTPLS